MAFIYCFKLKTTVDIGTTAGTGTGDGKKQSSAVMVSYSSFLAQCKGFGT